MKLSVNNVIFQGTTINANGNSSIFEKGWATQLILYCKVGSVSGSTPKMVIHIQSSPNKVDWFDMGLLNMSAAGNDTKTVNDFGKYIRLRWELTGGTPVFSDVDIWINYKDA